MVTAATGTVTIMFTDVVGSSVMRTGRGDHDAHRLIETHNDLVRREIERQGGQEVKTIGDAFMVAFASARRAVDCAIGVQRSLAAYNKRNPENEVHVRAGLNIGEVIQQSGD